MSCYVIQVKSGWEERTGKQLREILTKGRIFIPKRVMQIKQKGIWKRESYTLFAGYIFYETDRVAGEEVLECRQISHVSGFLTVEKKVAPIRKEEEAILSTLTSKGETIGLSQVQFSANSKVIIVDGPLKNIQGTIGKIDIRKRRAKLRIELHSVPYSVDVGLEFINPL